MPGFLGVGFFFIIHNFSRAYHISFLICADASLMCLDRNRVLAFLQGSAAAQLQTCAKGSVFFEENRLVLWLDVVVVVGGGSVVGENRGPCLTPAR